MACYGKVFGIIFIAVALITAISFLASWNPLGALFTIPFLVIGGITLMFGRRKDREARTSKEKEKDKVAEWQVKKQQQSIYCGKCGALNDVNSHYCSKCGSQILTNSISSQVKTEETPAQGYLREAGATPLEIEAIKLTENSLTLFELGKTKDAIAAIEDVVKRFGDNTRPDIKAQVAKTMANVGNGLHNDKKYKEAMAVFEEIIKLFDRHVCCRMK